MTTDRGPARYVPFATGRAAFHSTMSSGDGSDVSMRQREENRSLCKDNATIIVCKFHWHVRM